MNIKLKLLLIFLSIVLYSCRKEIRPEKGSIDLITNVYFDASKGLDKMQSFHFSKLNYWNNHIIEFVPDTEFPEFNSSVFYIKDSLCYRLDLETVNSILSEIVENQTPSLVRIKRKGAIFSDEIIPNYRNRKNLSDTVLFAKKYKRFEINSPWNYSRFYIYPTDTILPYTLYRHAEKEYGGRLERVDSYNKKIDMFVTLQLIPKKSWDERAKDIFEFNEYVKNRKINELRSRNR